MAKGVFQNLRALHNLTWIPLFLMGISVIGLGLSWVFSGEPWLLDRAANEVLLRTDFTTLFKDQLNTHLPEYLTAIYRFFGWWVTIIGILVVVYVQVTRMGTTLARNSIHAALTILLIGVYILEFRYIPISPFVYLTHGLSALVLISFIASQKLKGFD